MRPGQNKRMRGRNNNNNGGGNRRGPNPLTRSYESNGPDVKIRGTAHHVGEKYLQLARDAQSSGDPVMAESYLQHAEHYFRLIASAQLAQQQAQFGYQRQPGEQVEQDDDGDDDFESLPDRFASPSEKVAPVPQPQHQPQPQAYEPRNDRSYNDRQPYEARNNGQAQNGHYTDRPQQNDRGNDRPRQPYADRQDRNSQQQDRSGQQDRNGQDRGNQDRGGQERNGPERNGPERNGPERNGQERSAQERSAQGQDRGNANGGERPNRDYDNRNFRNRRDDRSRDGQPVRDFQPRPPVPDEQPVVGLPAFITAPTRVAVPDAAEAEQPVVAQVEAPAVAPETGEDAGFHMRPRRRRRPKSELANAEGGDRRRRWTRTERRRVGLLGTGASCQARKPRRKNATAASVRAASSSGGVEMP